MVSATQSKIVTHAKVMLVLEAMWAVGSLLAALFCHHLGENPMAMFLTWVSGFSTYRISKWWPVARTPVASERGFTLIELLIVVAIITVIVVGGIAILKALFS